MLQLESINPTGMFSFGLSEDIDLLDKGLVHLIGINGDEGGASNGAGKSSLPSALCEILYQANPTEISGDDVINTLWGRGFGGRVIFKSWDGIRYRVTYCRKFKELLYPSDNDIRTEYKGTGLYLDKFVDDVWVSCTQSSMQETKKLISNILGLTYDQFIAIAYMTPRAGNTLLTGTNKDKMDILGSLTGLTEWDDIVSNLRTEKAVLATKESNLKLDLAKAQGELTQLEQRYNETNETSINENIKNYEALIASTKAEIADLTAKQNQHRDQVNPIETKARDLYDQLTKMNADIVSLNKNSSPFYRKSPQIDADLASQLSNAQNHVFMIRGQLSAFGDNPLFDAENCPTCGAKVTKASKDRLTKAKNQLNGELAGALAEKGRVQNEIDADLKIKQMEIDAEVAEYEQKVAEIQKQVGIKTKMYTGLSEEYQRLNKLVADSNTQISVLNSQITQRQSTIAQLESNIGFLKNQLASLSETKARCESKQQDIAKLLTDLGTLSEDIACYDWLITNVPYIKLHKLAVSLEELSNLTNQYFERMGDSLRISFSSFAEKKKKGKSALSVDMLKGEISTRVYDGEKEIPVKLYSEGELARMRLATVRALHDLAVSTAQGCTFTFLDEIFSFVDKTNSHRIADGFPDTTMTTIVTDNSGLAQNIIQFDRTWTVRKLHGLSKLEV
jgi:DNA repair exonuclease SbcCD ATPase subunit